MPATMTLDDPVAIAAATHPVRAAILDAMRQPATAAAVARRIGQTRQNVAYHVRELEKAGLLRHVGQRQNLNVFVSNRRSFFDVFCVIPGLRVNDFGAGADGVEQCAGPAAAASYKSNLHGEVVGAESVNIRSAECGDGANAGSSDAGKRSRPPS